MMGLLSVVACSDDVTIVEMAASIQLDCVEDPCNTPEQVDLDRCHLPASLDARTAVVEAPLKERNAEGWLITRYVSDTHLVTFPDGIIEQASVEHPFTGDALSVAAMWKSQIPLFEVDIDGSLTVLADDLLLSSDEDQGALEFAYIAGAFSKEMPATERHELVSVTHRDVQYESVKACCATIDPRANRPVFASALVLLLVVRRRSPPSAVD